MTQATEILGRLPGMSEDARFEALKGLVSDPDHANKKAFEDAISASSPLVKLLYVRFLGRWRDEAALNSLIGLFFDANPAVIEACRKAFDRHQDPRKWGRLIPVLGAPVREARHYAVDRLGQGAVRQAVMPLLRLLASNTDETVERVLSALRHLPEKVFLEDIPAYLHHSREGVRFKAALVMAALYEEGYGKARYVLTHALKRDGASRVRQAAAWGLRRRKSKRDLELFMACSVGDPDPMVRQECLLALGAFPSPRVISHLLGVLVNEKDRMVVLKGEGVLFSVPVPKLTKALSRIYRSADRALSVKALLMFAELEEESRPFSRYLVRRLAKARQDGDKLPYIEAIGLLRRHDALPMLESLLGSSPLIAYAAMAAIVRIWGNDAGFPALRYLSDPGLSALIKQMVIKNFVRNESWPADDPGLMRMFHELLSSENLNLRYLSAVALSRFPNEQAFEPLLDMLLRETDPSSLRLLKDSVAHMFTGNPGLFAAAFEKYGKDPGAVALLLSYLEDVRLSSENIHALFGALFAEFSDATPIVNRKILYKTLFHFVSHRLISLAQVLDIVIKSGKRAEAAAFLAERLREHPGLRLDVPVGALVSEFEDGSRFARADVLEFLSRGDPGEAVPALATIVARRDYAEYHSQAARGLRLLTGFPE